MLPIDPPGRPSPLGTPVRREEWYIIANNSLTTCTVSVYPGEVVGLQQKVYEQLESGVVQTTEDYKPGDAIYLIQYERAAELLRKNGFARL